MSEEDHFQIKPMYVSSFILILALYFVPNRPDKEITLIVTEPQVMLDAKFQEYYEKNINRKIHVVSSVYIEECLTSSFTPRKSDFQVNYWELLLLGFQKFRNVL